MDNSKIKRFVPDFVATTRFRDGVARSVAWFEADPTRRQVDPAFNEKWDQLIEVYQLGLKAAVHALSGAG